MREGPEESVQPIVRSIFTAGRQRSFANTFTYEEFCCHPTHPSFLGGSVVKNLPANAGNAGLILGLRRSPGEGNGNPLQYSCLGEQRKLVAHTHLSPNPIEKESVFKTTEELVFIEKFFKCNQSRAKIISVFMTQAFKTVWVNSKPGLARFVSIL